MRAHMKVRFANGAVGETTSGGFAPTMKQSIALARVECQSRRRAAKSRSAANGCPARVVKPPFVRNGKVLV